MSTISVIIPVYNSEKTLTRCFESVKNQTYKDFEVLLINDGSTDNSRAICEEYCKYDHRFNLINQKNSGPSAARNTGLDNATSEYILFLDSDDYAELNMFEELLNACLKNNADLSMCSYITERAAGESVKRYFKHTPRLYDANECENFAAIFIDKWQKDITSYSWLRLVKREIIENPKLRFNVSVRRSEDYLFWVQVHFRIKSMQLITHQHLYHYVLNENSITHSYIKNFYAMAREIHSELKNSVPLSEKTITAINFTLIQFSYVGLHISAKANSFGQFKKDMFDSLYDAELKKAVKSVNIKDLPSMRHKLYFLPFKLRLKWLLKIYYTFRFIKHRKHANKTYVTKTKKGAL